MVEVLQAVFLGVVQGVAEFLPISSSGHLRIIQDVFGWTKDFGLAFDMLLHVGTLLAVIVYFRDDLSRMILAVFSRSLEHAGDRRLAWLLAIATFVTGCIGLIGGDWLTETPTLYVGIAFMGTSIILIAAERLSSRKATNAGNLHWSQAVAIGLAQGAAIMPGISRSGATMAACLVAGLDREQAARFSFLLSVPIILLASGYQMVEVLVEGTVLPGAPAMIAGFLTSTITGYLTIAGLMNFIKRHSFAVFSVYTALIGIGVILWQVAT